MYYCSCKYYTLQNNFKILFLTFICCFYFDIFDCLIERCSGFDISKKYELFKSTKKTAENDKDDKNEDEKEVIDNFSTLQYVKSTSINNFCYRQSTIYLIKNIIDPIVEGIFQPPQFFC